MFWAINDTDYDTVGDSASNAWEGIVVPIIVGGVFLAIAATVLGWWKPAMRETERIGPSWARWALPGALAAGAIINLATTGWDKLDGEFIAAIAIGTAAVGFSEELLTRGLMLVGARGSMSERWAMVFTAFMFGILHVTNAFFGQSVADTARQTVFAVIVGVMYYVTRRVTGTLVVTMVVHWLWDFGVFATNESDSSGTGTLLLWVALIVTVVVLVPWLRQPRKEPATVTAPT